MNKKVVFLYIFFFSLLSFCLTFKAGFIWDDHQMIISNPYIKSFNMPNIIHNFFSNAFNREGSIYYRPLQLLSYMFDFYFFKLNPLGWHIVNFLIHFFNSFFIFLLLKKLDFNDEIAFFSSLFFAVNPVVVEQMLIIAGRAELMTLFFSLLSILFYLKNKTFTLIISLFFFLLSMLSKESGVITPFIIILCIWFKGERNYSKNILIYFLLIPFYLALRKAAVGTLGLEINFYNFLINLFLKTPLVILNYLQKTFFPFNLHSYNVIKFNIYLYIFALIFVVYLKYYIFAINRNKVYIFSWLWYFIFLLPKLPLFGLQNLVLDHWVYPSNAGLFISFAWLLFYIKDKLLKSYYFVLIFFLSLWISFSINNIGKRDSDIKIYEHAVNYPTSAYVYYNLGREYYLKGNYEKAKKMIEKVIRDYEDDEMFLNAYALINWRTGDSLKAIETLKHIIKQGAKMPITYINMASILVKEKEYDKALNYLFIGNKVFPQDEEIKLYMARIFSLKGQKKQAKELLKNILEFNPYNPEALLNMGKFEFDSKNFKKSKEYFKKLLEINPGNSIAMNYLYKLEN